MPEEIRFDDGAAYERFMGTWSRLVGSAFLDWLAPRAGNRWIDVGCGNGAFTQLLIDRCDPGMIAGIDPSEPQLEFARKRIATGVAEFRRGDAMDLPYPDATFDAAVMPLVLFFVPEPSVGVEEMRRVVRPGGSVSAYAWDIPGGAFPYEAVWSLLREEGVDYPLPPSDWASNIDAMRELWTSAGLSDVETRAITVSRTFADFDDYWETIRHGPSTGRGLGSMTPAALEAFKARLRERMTPDADGRLTISARANAAKGRVPA